MKLKRYAENLEMLIDYPKRQGDYLYSTKKDFGKHKIVIDHYIGKTITKITEYK